MNETGFVPNENDTIRRAQEEWRQRKRQEIEQKARKKAARRSVGPEHNPAAGTVILTSPSAAAPPPAPPPAAPGQPGAVAAPPGATGAPATTADGRTVLAYPAPAPGAHAAAAAAAAAAAGLPHTLVAPVHAKHALSPEGLASQALASQVFAAGVTSGLPVYSAAPAPAQTGPAAAAAAAAGAVAFSMDQQASQLHIQHQLLQQQHVGGTATAAAAQVGGRVVPHQVKLMHSAPAGSTAATAAGVPSTIQISTVAPPTSAAASVALGAQPGEGVELSKVAAEANTAASGLLQENAMLAAKDQAEEAGKAGGEHQFPGMLQEHIAQGDPTTTSVAAAAAVVARSVDLMQKTGVAGEPGTTGGISMANGSDAAHAEPAVSGANVGEVAPEADDAESEQLRNLELQRQWRAAKRREIALKKARGAASKRGRKRTKPLPPEDRSMSIAESPPPSSQAELTMNTHSVQLLSMASDAQAAGAQDRIQSHEATTKHADVNGENEQAFASHQDAAEHGKSDQIAAASTGDVHTLYQTSEAVEAVVEHVTQVENAHEPRGNEAGVIEQTAEPGGTDNMQTIVEVETHGVQQAQPDGLLKSEEVSDAVGISVGDQHAQEAHVEVEDADAESRQVVEVQVTQVCTTDGSALEETEHEDGTTSAQPETNAENVLDEHDNQAIDQTHVQDNAVESTPQTAEEGGQGETASHQGDVEMQTTADASEVAAEEVAEMSAAPGEHAEGARAETGTQAEALATAVEGTEAVGQVAVAIETEAAVGSTTQVEGITAPQDEAEAMAGNTATVEEAQVAVEIDTVARSEEQPGATTATENEPVDGEVDQSAADAPNAEAEAEDQSSMQNAPAPSNSESVGVGNIEGGGTDEDQPGAEENDVREEQGGEVQEDAADVGRVDPGEGQSDAMECEPELTAADPHPDQDAQDDQTSALGKRKAEQLDVENSGDEPAAAKAKLSAEGDEGEDEGGQDGFQEGGEEGMSGAPWHSLESIDNT